MTIVVPAASISTMGIALAPVVPTIAMPDFSALLASVSVAPSATAVPSIVTLAPMSPDKGMPGGTSLLETVPHPGTYFAPAVRPPTDPVGKATTTRAPPPAEPDRPSALSDVAKPVTAASLSVTDVLSPPMPTASGRKDPPHLPASTAPDEPAPTSDDHPDDDLPASDMALGNSLPAESGAVAVLAMPTAASSLASAPSPRQSGDAVAAAALAPRALPAAGPIVVRDLTLSRPPTASAPLASTPLATPNALSGPATRDPQVDHAGPLAGSGSRPVLASVRASGSDHLAPPGAPPVMLSSPDALLVARISRPPPAASLPFGAPPALPPVLLPIAAVPMNEAIPVAPSVAIVRAAVPAATPDSLLSQAALAALPAPAGPATAPSPSAAPRPVEMTAALPGPAMATRPSGNPRLPRALPDTDDRAFALTIATTAEPQRSFAPVRATPQAIEMPGTTTVIAPELAMATDIAIRSDQLGAVRIGIEGAPGDLRVSLGLPPAAVALVVADAPRLLAELAAVGVRLQSLDVSGSGFAGGQGPSQGGPQHQPQPGSAPRSAVTADSKPFMPVRARTADRYA